MKKVNKVNKLNKKKKLTTEEAVAILKPLTEEWKQAKKQHNKDLYERSKLTRKTVIMSLENYQRLCQYGNFNESFDDVLKRVLDIADGRMTIRKATTQTYEASEPIKQTKQTKQPNVTVEQEDIEK